jgi:hypothetical protein
VTKRPIHTSEALTKAEHDAIAATRTRPLTQDPIKRRPHTLPSPTDEPIASRA